MNALTPALRTDHPLSINLTGKEKMLRDFGSDKDFKLKLEELLARSGFGGQFTVTVDTKIKGRSHTQGFLLGTPNLHRRSVEVRWQAGGNDTRFSLLVNVPHGMEPIEFHTRLDQSMRQLENGVRAKEVAEVLPARTPQEDAPKLTAEDIELLLREVVPTATAAGMVSRQACIDVLSQLGRQDFDAELRDLVAAGHLEPGKSKGFLRIADSWLQKLRTGSDEIEPDTATRASQQLSEAAAPTPNNLLTEVEKLTKLVEEAGQYRTHLPDLRREADQLTTTIAELSARLEAITPRIAEAEAFLGDPDVQHAEQMLSTLRQLLSKK